MTKNYRLRAQLLPIRYRYEQKLPLPGTITTYSLPLRPETSSFGHDYDLFITVTCKNFLFRARLRPFHYRYVQKLPLSGTITLYSLPLRTETSSYGHDYCLFVTATNRNFLFRARLRPYHYRYKQKLTFPGTITAYSLPYQSNFTAYGYE